MEEVKNVKQDVAEKGNPSDLKKQKVTVIEFSDLNVHCKKKSKKPKQPREQYKDKIRWVFQKIIRYHSTANANVCSYSG